MTKCHHNWILDCISGQIQIMLNLTYISQIVPLLCDFSVASENELPSSTKALL